MASARRSPARAHGPRQASHACRGRGDVGQAVKVGARPEYTLKDQDVTVPDSYSEDLRDLQHQFIDAVDQHLAEQKRSMAAFLDSMATLCEKEPNANRIAQAMRSMYATDSEVDCEVVRGISPDIDDAVIPEELVPVKVKGEREISIDDKDIPIPDEIKRDFKVENLDFVDEHGNLIPPPSQLISMLGPHVQDRLWALESLLKYRWKPMDGRFARAVQSSAVQALGSLVIGLNYIFIIVQSDTRIAHLKEEETQLMVNIGYFFTAYYTLELLAMILVLRVDFFFGSEAGWNMFDMTIVIVAIFETVSKWIGVTGMNTSFLRIMRFMKMSRVLRMFSAMRAFKEIKIMVDALTSCLTLFVFSTILLAIFISVFAIFIVQGAAGYLEEIPDDFKKELVIRNRFGTVATSMLTLYKCALGGADWGLVHENVSDFGLLYNYLFLLYINFSFIAFFNVVIGVFCEKALSLAAIPSTQELVANRKIQEHSDAADLLDQLRGFIKEGCGLIDKAVFDEFIADPHVVSYFEVRGVKPSSVSRVFQSLCDIHKTTTVDLKMFVSTLVKLDGPASAMDLHALSVRQLHANHVVRLAQRANRADVNLNHMDVLQHHEEVRLEQRIVKREINAVQKLLNAVQKPATASL